MDDLISLLEGFIHSVSNEDIYNIDAKSFQLLLLKFKSTSRGAVQSSEALHADIEKRKETVDTMHLTLQNLLYMQGNLIRETNECKDISTPNLDVIEDNIKEAISLTPQSVDTLESIDEIHKNAVAKLEIEQNTRVKTQEEYEQMSVSHVQNFEIQEKKLKHLNDVLPGQIKEMKVIAEAMQSQLSVI